MLPSSSSLSFFSAALEPCASSSAGEISSHNAPNAESVASSVSCLPANVGNTRETSSSTVAGSNAASVIAFSGPRSAKGNLRTVESASFLGAWSKSANCLAACEVDACAIWLRTAASVSLAASSRSSSCT